MRTIAVIGRKGGSGKTTIASHLAIGAYLRDRKTLLADTDPQLSSTQTLSLRVGGGPETIETNAAQLPSLHTAAQSAGVDAFLIDTPAVLEEETARAASLANLCLLVLRPTYLDLSSAVRTSAIIREQRKPGMIVLNQAPTARENVEAPIVRRSIEALKLLRLPLAPVIIRSRTAYQTALESGRSVEETAQDPVAAQEISALCAYVDRFLFGEKRPAA